jgi:hypothetical protein
VIIHSSVAAPAGDATTKTVSATNRVVENHGRLCFNIIITPANK